MNPDKLIYPVFLQHAGCPFQCVYCNQFAVTSGEKGDIFEAARARLDLHAEQVKTSGRPGEAAFYGGTFSALPRPVMTGILEYAGSMVSRGIFTGIRFSTRPDCLGEEICEILDRFPVKTIELGAQSLSDSVLDASGRGYTAKEVIESAALVRQRGWLLGIQLMAGLPGDSASIFLQSVNRTIEIGPDFVRIYPALVLRGSRLADMFGSGAYKPLSVDEAIDWVVPGFDMLLAAGIPAARMGLQADPALDLPGVVLAGPNHPAFGYLVRCRWWRERIERELAGRAGGSILIRSASNRISEIIGPQRSNIGYFESELKFSSVIVKADPVLTGMQFVLEFSD